MTTTVLGPPRCPRCKDGYLGPDWEGLTCVNCGYNWMPQLAVPLDIPKTRDLSALLLVTCRWCGVEVRSRVSTKWCSESCKARAKRARGVLREARA